MTGIAMKNLGGRPLKFKSVEELQKKIDQYFKSCFEQKIDMFGNPIFIKDEKGNKTKKKVMIQRKPFTVQGLAVFLECSDVTLLNYEVKQRFFKTIKAAKDKIYAYAVEALYNNHNSTGVIFSLKNNYNWKDESQIKNEHSGEMTIKEVTYESTKH